MLTVLSCGTRLPSLEPLGRGPLAEAEPQPKEGEAARRPRRLVRGPTAVAGADAAPADAGQGEDAAPGKPEASADAGAPDASRDADPASAAILAGEYRGPDTTIYRVRGFPERREDDPNARTRVELEGGDALRVLIVSSADGEILCDLAGTAKGTDAVIAPGQECFSEGEAATATVRQGKATFTERRLVLDLMIDLEAWIEDERHAGEIEYHFDGTLP